MASQGPINKSRAGLGGFPARFKSFVQDMKSFRKDIYRHRRATRSEEIAPKPLLPSQELIPTSTSLEDVSVSETRSLFRDSPRVRSLSIRVTVKFDEPLNYTHSQDYEGSSSLQPTEELCEALIRRVDHCSKELITRRDSSALDRTGIDGLAKPLRYEIHLQVLRNEMGTGTEAWASRTLRSYQRQSLSTEAAREVILSTHYMVGIFLRHHDEAFVWKDGPVREDPVQEQKTFPYRPGRVQPLTSIPRSYFIERQQEFESIPGYTVCFSFTSQNHHRNPARWHETVEVNSNQLSPLTLANAEDLFLDACYAVDGVFKLQRKEFGALQDSCATHSGCRHCRPHDGDGIEMLVSVKNNVGPQFDNLERTTSTSINVFWEDHARDCVEFVEKAKAAIVQVCRETDESVSRMNDFEFYIIELRGRGWTIDEPLAFTLGPESCICRRTVESLLDRLQTGVADVLRGNAIAVRMTARKRGHFILHKTLVAREPIEKPGNKKKSIAKSKAYVLDRLKQRIERDIEMVCKDTCTIVKREIETAKPDRAASAPPQEYASMKTGLVSSRRLSDLTMLSKIPAGNEHDPSTDRLGSSGGELVETQEPSSTPSIPQHLWTRVSRDPVTGQRLFPLVPSRHASQELTTAGSHESTSRHNALTRDGTTTTSFDLSTSRDLSNTFTAQTTSDSSISNTDQESTETSSKESHNDRRETHNTEGSTVSTRPRTPDLISGGSPSARSSIIITPKIHESVLRNEIGIVQKPTPDVEGGESDENGKVDNYLQKLHMHRPVSSPISRQTSRDGSFTSAISQPRPAQQEHPLSHQHHRDTPPAEIETASQSDAKFKSDIAPIEPIAEPDTPTEEEHHSALATETNTKIEDFSQSKPDFDFSSPFTTPSPEDGEAIGDTSSSPAKEGEVITPGSQQQEHQDKDKDTDTAVADPPDDADDALVDLSPEVHLEPAVLRHQHSKSFGSAGYLGSFHDQRFYGVGLRRALVGSSSTPPRPVSRLGSRDGEERPGSSMM
ncbi:hypothetical protein F4859DRAFT_367265 [Xylaria cf. heliscus]|nr:hypothetical protein F4859DRAFT_367265 [Xylaria cf. heliscus]